MSIKVNTPVSKLMWVNISGKGKINHREDGYQYTACAVLPKEKAEELLSVIHEFYDANKSRTAKTKSLSYKYCDEDGKSNDAGDHISFNFKTGTVYKDGKNKKIRVFNSKAREVDLGDVRVGNGSMGVISGTLDYYSMGKDKNKEDGASLWLNSIQIVNLVEYKTKVFSEQEGTFEDVETNDEGFVGQTVSNNQTQTTVNTQVAGIKPIMPRL